MRVDFIIDRNIGPDALRVASKLRDAFERCDFGKLVHVAGSSWRASHLRAESVSKGPKKNDQTGNDT